MHISTKADFHNVWTVSKNMGTSAAGRPFWVAWVVSWRLPAPLGRPPGSQRQRHSTDAVWVVWVVSWRPPGLLWEASRPPKPRSRDGDNMMPVTQNLDKRRFPHWSTLPQGPWAEDSTAMEQECVLEPIRDGETGLVFGPRGGFSGTSGGPPHRTVMPRKVGQ